MDNTISDERLDEITNAAWRSGFETGRRIGEQNSRFDSESEAHQRIMRIVERAATPAKSESCGCIFNFDDKFYESHCAEHKAENEWNQGAEYEACCEQIPA